MNQHTSLHVPTQRSSPSSMFFILFFLYGILSWLTMLRTFVRRWHANLTPLQVSIYESTPHEINARGLNDHLVTMLEALDLKWAFCTSKNINYKGPIFNVNLFMLWPQACSWWRVASHDYSTTNPAREVGKEILAILMHLKWQSLLVDFGYCVKNKAILIRMSKITGVTLHWRMPILPTFLEKGWILGMNSMPMYLRIANGS